LYVLLEDSHASFLSRWLEGFNVDMVSMESLENVIASNERVGLIVGPNGADSGISILTHSTLQDFYVGKLYDYKFTKKAQKVTLPYYAYLPSFLLEEEVSQGLYFMGKTPDYRADSKNLTLLLWDNQN